jgi:2-dehydropantoate 2-reductase
VRILVVGAGAIGGYFGGRLLEAKQDVTFLVRHRRAEQLAKSGLQIRSPHGDIDLAMPPTILADTLQAPFDVVLLSCKAYDLEGAIASFAPAVGPQTVVLPLLNGMRHIDILSRRFSSSRVLGGQCVISVVLESDGRIVHMNDTHSLSFGERDRSRSARVMAVGSAFAGARFESRVSDAILQEMWEKWVFIATGAGLTCLMRAAVGDIVAAGGVHLVTSLLDECSAIAAREGFSLRPEALDRTKATFAAPGSTLTASMLRDVERNAPIEADHIVGDLLSRAGGTLPNSLLQTAYVHLKAYEARRAREGRSRTEPLSAP